MAVDIGPKIGIDGEAEFRKELNNINQQLKTLGSEMKSVTSAFDAGDDAEKALAEQTRILNQQIDTQEQKLKQLQKGLELATEKFGKADSNTLRWQQAVHEATAELNRMKSQLNNVENGVDGMTDAIDDSGNAFEGFGKALVTGLSVGTVVNGVKELATSMMDLVTGTQEYRTIMGSLEISSQNAGYKAQQTSETYKQLYGVLGDTQTAATATANLQALGLSQDSLTQLTNAAIGAWATYGDSIPIDQLAESINLGAQQSEVSSALADTIEWAGGNVDEFKARLEEANSAEERANIIAQELANQGLAQAGEAWRQNNQDIVAVNEAQAELDEAMGDLGELLAPLAAKVINFGADAIGALVQWLSDAAEAAKNAYNWLREFFNLDEKESRRHELLPGAIDGSHAGGLNYVPFDGYLAQLHRGELVLTAAQASLLRANQGASDSSAAVSSLSNAISDLQNGLSVPKEIYLTLRSNDGTTLGRWLVPFVRDENSADPEVVSDLL